SRSILTTPDPPVPRSGLMTTRPYRSSMRCRFRSEYFRMSGTWTAMSGWRRSVFSFAHLSATVRKSRSPFPPPLSLIHHIRTRKRRVEPLSRPPKNVRCPTPDGLRAANIGHRICRHPDRTSGEVGVSLPVHGTCGGIHETRREIDCRLHECPGFEGFRRHPVRNLLQNDGPY